MPCKTWGDFQKVLPLRSLQPDRSSSRKPVLSCNHSGRSTQTRFCLCGKNILFVTALFCTILYNMLTFGFNCFAVKLNLFWKFENKLVKIYFKFLNYQQFFLVFLYLKFCVFFSLEVEKKSSQLNEKEIQF